MGLDKNETFRGRMNKGKEKPNGARRGEFLVFHPTEAEKTQLSQMPPSIEAAWDRIFKLTQESVSVTLGYKPENGSHFIICRNKAVVWEQDTPLSVWHSDMNKAAQALCFALDTRWGGYPYESVGDPGKFTDEW